MRKNIVAGNWKMNKTFSDADDLMFEIKELMANQSKENTEMIICPPFIFMELATDVAEESNIKIGAQNVAEFDNGAYTGEVSAEQLNSMEVDYCIIGHSERRKYFHENSKSLAIKTNKLLEYGISPIFCCGEVLEEREANKQEAVVRQQIQEALWHLSADEIQNIVLAYEPVWAIGTGKTATAEQAQEMHAFIRSLLTEKYGKDVSDNISILYGGSCNAGNAKDLFANPDVDGGLIGGAALKAKDFVAIYNSFGK